MEDEVMRDTIKLYLKSGFPLIAINTMEVQRAVSEVGSIVSEWNKELVNTNAPDFLKKNGYAFCVWDVLMGFNNSSTVDLVKAVEHVRKDAVSEGVFVFQNAHLLWDNPMVFPKLAQHFIQIAAEECRYKHLLFVGSIHNLPSEAARLFSVVDFDLPGREELSEVVTQFEEILENPVSIDNKNMLIDNLAGMTIFEAKQAVKAAIVKTKGMEIDKAHVLDEKAKAVKRSGLMEYVKTSETMASVGGATNLKNWLMEIGTVFRNPRRAFDFGLPVPKGCLVTGVSGTGKSLIAKAVASEFGVPLFRVDVGRVFGSLVGETERNTRELFSLIDAVSPCTVLLDEIEKSMAGLESSSHSDAGVTSRFFGAFLTKLAEKTSMSFFVATANDVTKLPPEFLRRGRFDAMFFVDLPEEKERFEILSIHLRKVGRDPKSFDVKKLAKVTVGFTGSELEGLVIDGLYRAFKADRDLVLDDMLEVINITPLLSKTKAEEITALRNWARGRARIANVTSDSEKPTWMLDRKQSKKDVII
jgi:ATP-dependent 26S proteasome regulatory subunit